MAEAVVYTNAGDHIGEDGKGNVFRGDIVAGPKIEPTRGGGFTMTFDVHVTEKSASGDYKDPDWQNGENFRVQAKLFADVQSIRNGKLSERLRKHGYYGDLAGLPAAAFKGKITAVKATKSSNPEKYADSWFIDDFFLEFPPADAKAIGNLLSSLNDGFKASVGKRSQKGGDDGGTDPFAQPNY